MKVAIVGYSGLIGSHILAAHPKAALFNSQNIQELRGKSFDLMFLSTLPAEKWKANKFPETDKLVVEKVSENLSHVSSRDTVLISTVDVFAKPRGVEEGDTPGKFGNTCYGSNRFQFEEFVTSHFPNTWIARLPALVGTGLKKNVIYDLKHGKSVIDTPRNSTFQFYPLSRINFDLQVIMRNPSSTYHIVAEPISLDALSTKLALDENLFGPEVISAPHYDVRTSKSALWETQGKYQVTQEESIRAVKEYLLGG